MKNFIKRQIRGLLYSDMVRLIYAVILAVPLSLLAYKFHDVMLVKILAIFPWAYLLYYTVKGIVYAWIINPLRSRKNKKK